MDRAFGEKGDLSQAAPAVFAYCECEVRALRTGYETTVSDTGIVMACDRTKRPANSRVARQNHLGSAKWLRGHGRRVVTRG